MSIKKIKKKWTILDVISWASIHFTEKKITNSRLEIEWLLCDVLNCQRIDLYLRFEETLNETNLSKTKQLIKKRLLGEPLQYIINKGTFYGRDFFVNSDVLIPRPETELIITILKNKKNLSSVLEVGTGSGCIAITCFLEGLCQNITATDISKKALKIATQNAQSYRAENIKFELHDFLNQKINDTFDVVLSNPPYIQIEKINTLPLEVKNFEPKIALTDYGDGLSFYRNFSNKFHNIINPKGCLIVEINSRIKLDEILSIFHNKNLKTKVFQDLQKDNRVIEVYE